MTLSPDFAIGIIVLGWTKGPDCRVRDGEKLVKIGARIVRHGRYVVFQLAAVAMPRALFADILRRIDGLRLRSPPLPA